MQDDLHLCKGPMSVARRMQVQKFLSALTTNRTQRLLEQLTMGARPIPDLVCMLSVSVDLLSGWT